MKKGLKQSKEFLRYHYTKCFEFFKETKPYIHFSLGIFLLFSLIGFIFPIFFREAIFEFVKELAFLLDGKGPLELTILIFWNNLRSSFFAMILGVGFGIFPLFVGTVNGYILGFISRESVNEAGPFILWRLIPHGIFEIPAIILSIGIGLKIGTCLLKEDLRKDFKKNFVEGLRFFFFVIFPLLLVAAIIEGILVGFLS